MRCSGCGKDVPFSGHVCPYCQRSKSSDQAGTVATVIGLVIGGFIGNLIGGFGGMIVGGFMLGVLFATVSLMGKGHSAHKPPLVRIDREKARPSASPPPMNNVSAGIAERLRTVDKLHADGLLTAEERDIQRQVIISSL